MMTQYRGKKNTIYSLTQSYRQNIRGEPMNQLFDYQMNHDFWKFMSRFRYHFHFLLLIILLLTNIFSSIGTPQWKRTFLCIEHLRLQQSSTFLLIFCHVMDQTSHGLIIIHLVVHFLHCWFEMMSCFLKDGNSNMLFFGGFLKNMVKQHNKWRIN